MPYREQIDKSRIPAHVAIIMDGNGRWAKQRGQARSFGHQAGAETVHIIAEEAARLGVKYLTLYTFSTENWNVYVKELATGKEKQLSLDGTLSNYYSAYIRWSPDSKKVASCKGSNGG